jgi:hypothetical protein
VVLVAEEVPRAADLEVCIAIAKPDRVGVVGQRREPGASLRRQPDASG